MFFSTNKNMLNQKSIDSVNQSQFNQYFKKPLYESYCFSNINNLIEYVLGINEKLISPKDIFGNLSSKYEKVILFFIDGFGWQFFEKFYDNDFLKLMIKNGVVNKFTSQFPSTTSAHTTKIHTDSTIGESGIYEWFYYEPQVDEIIAPLLFSYAGNKKRDTLKKTKIKSEKLFPSKTFYQKLKKQEIESYVFQHKEYTPSTYSNIVFKGAKVYGYKTIAEAIVNLFEKITQEKNKSYYFLYFDQIDSISHQYGPSSPYTEAQIITFLAIMKEIFLKNFFQFKKTLFVLTADHGQVEINPKTTIYLNQIFPKIKNWLKKNKKGRFLVPAGSCRDMFLYIKEEFLDEAEKTLQKKLKGIAEVYQTNHLIKKGLFGKNITKKFLERIGNLVILPYKNQSVWWYQKNRFEQRYYGHHGGLTKEEIEIPMIFLSN